MQGTASEPSCGMHPVHSEQNTCDGNGGRSSSGLPPKPQRHPAPCPITNGSSGPELGGGGGLRLPPLSSVPIIRALPIKSARPQQPSNRFVTAGACAVPDPRCGCLQFRAPWSCVGWWVQGRMSPCKFNLLIRRAWLTQVNLRQKAGEACNLVKELAPDPTHRL